MGQLIYSVITSLDGYFADADGGFDWAVPDDEVLAAVNRELRGGSTYLYGRRMYELMTVWETDPELAAGSPGEAEFAEIWQAAEKVVYSRTLAPSELVTRRTRLERRFEAAAVERVRADADGDLFVDGPTLAATALRLGLVDRLHLVVCPVVVGGGLPVLPAGLRLDLRLEREQRFGNGMVGLKYAVRS